MTSPISNAPSINQNPIVASSAKPKTAISNGRVVSLLKEEIEERKKILPTTIEDLKKRFLSCAPWYKDEGETRFPWYRKWSLITAQAIVTGVSLGYFAYNFWRVPEDPVHQGCYLIPPSNDCYSYYNFNNKTDCSIAFGDGWHLCQTGLRMTFGGIMQDIGLAAFHLGVGIAGAPSLLTFIETESVAAIMSWAESYSSEKICRNIQSCTADLSAYGDNEFSISKQLALRIYELNLLKSTRQSIVSEMNAKQTLQLKKHLGDARFYRFTDEVISPTQQLIVRFFEFLDQLEIKKITQELQKLKPFMKLDKSLWGEITYAIENAKLSSQDSNLINAVLLKIGKDIGVLSDKATVQDFRTIISIVIFCNGTPQEPRKIRIENLVKIKYFDRILHFEISKMKEKEGIVLNRDNFEFEVEVENQSQQNAVEKLLDYIEFKELSLDRNLVKDLLPYASTFGMEDCVRICSNYLYSNQDQFNTFKLLELVLSHAHFEDLEERNLQFLQQKFQEALQNYNYIYIDRFLELIAQHQLKIDVIKHIEEVLKTNITILSKDIHILKECRQLEKLYPLIEQRYLQVINDSIFWELWDFADTHKKTRIQDACNEFKNKQDNESLAAILMQRKHVTIPIEFMDMV